MSVDGATNKPQADESDAMVLVCSLQQLQSRHKMLTTINGRSILVVIHNGVVYALDSKCYHSGGPLHQGEVKDIEDHPCVVCPWHRYILCLNTGEGLYQAINPQNPSEKPEWKSKGVKQRVHNVQIKNGDVYVSLSDLTAQVESDYYYSEEYRNMIGSALKALKS